MKKYFTVLSVLLLSTATFACLNFYIINEAGRESMYEDYPPYQIMIDPKRDLESLKLYEKWIKEDRGADQHRYISNYSAYLMKLGRNKEALTILQKLVKQKPNEYEIMANLATAYELNGQLDSALKYMRQSLRINPHSHKDSEWFHVRLLEAAIAARDQHLNIETMDILKLGNSSSLDVAYQAGHQLKERVPLTSAPNVMLSKVLEETADYYKRKVSIDWSVKLYAMAIGYTNYPATRERIWAKINAARARIVQLSKVPSKKRDHDPVRVALLKSSWQQYLQKDIQYWEGYRSHYEQNLVVLKF